MPRSEGRAGARGSAAILLALVLASACSFDYEGAKAPGGEELPDAVFHDFDHSVYMGGTRVLSLERDGDRLQLVKVWNQTGELEGEMNLSFRHVVGDPGQQFYLGVENPFATRLPA